EAKNVPGTPTGLKDVDKKLGGLRGGRLIVVGARPAMGKTGLALKIAQSAGQHGTALVFSIEMSKVELGLRLMATVKKLRGDLLQQPKNLSDTDMKHVFEAGDILEQHNILVDDSQSLSVMDIRSRARQQVRKRPDVNVIIIDYLQIMETRGDNPNLEYGVISRRLKQLARELNVPVVLLSQLSRRVETRPNKRPIMSDLRDSGAIEQDADQVCFIMRPEYYWNDPPIRKGEADIIVAKNRHGPVGDVAVQWEASFASFRDLARPF
ncbi:MAG: DnaB-like helicase C-terminal domain-containing protein, partial [Deinococcota bacterium]